MISNMNKEYHIAEGVTAFSTTRKGGVSQGNYSEFNINDYCGDCAEHVAENRRKLADELGISTDHIILPHQVHGVEVRQVAGDYFSMPENIRKMILEGVDAVMTKEMAFAYHTEPKKLKAVIGPGISLEHFEVGDEVYEAFEQAAFPMEEIAEQRPNAAFSVDIAERERLAAEGNIVQPLKWHINLPLCNKQILLHCGVAEENIQDCGICTFAHSDEFFSARKLGIESGRIYTGILMK